jgi:hypothetical protein
MRTFRAQLKFTKMTPLPVEIKSPIQRKKAFDFSEVLTKVRQTTLPFPKATLFELARRGYTNLFQQLTPC